MTASRFILFLQERMEEARGAFFEARQELESYEAYWGEQYLGSDPWESEAQALADLACASYKEYKRAWVEWYAAMNRMPITPSRDHKSTEAFFAPVPSHELRELITESVESPVITPGDLEQASSRSR